jgi:signal transduction histidine kinase
MASTADGAERPWLQPAGWMVVALATAALAVLAARADLAPGAFGADATVVDLAVGLVFVGGAALARAPWRSRLLFSTVGLAWLVGSFLPGAKVAYLGILATALALFPSGRPRTARDWLSVVLPLPVVLVIPTQPVLAGLFAAVAASALAVRRWERVAAWAPAVAAASLGIVLAVSWVVEVTQPRGFDPPVWKLALELVLLVVALGFPVASWAVMRERARLADRLLGDDRVVGIEGLALLLAETIGDPRLRIYRWDPASGAYLGPDGLRLEPHRRTALIRVDDADAPLAAIVHGETSAMQDPTVAAAAVEAVRLTATNERRQTAERRQLAQREAARGRLLVSTDRQRQAIAARLRDEVVGPIQDAVAVLRRIDPSPLEPEPREALVVAGRELEASVGEILALIDGVPPATLGDGGLVAAIRVLAERCPLPVSVSATPDAAADVARETALFYVCSEALANATKHARASRVSIDLRRERDDLVITVSDDGVGGARLSGFGVDSTPGAATTLTARIAG